MTTPEPLPPIPCPSCGAADEWRYWVRTSELRLAATGEVLDADRSADRIESIYCGACVTEAGFPASAEVRAAIQERIR